MEQKRNNLSICELYTGCSVKERGSEHLTLEENKHIYQKTIPL